MKNFISLAIAMFNLNRGVSQQGKQVVKEGLDVIKAISLALKDKKITKKEKTVIVAEIQQFSKVAIKMVDSIVIPE